MQEWMDEWLGFYSSFSNIGPIELGCQWKERSNMDEAPFENWPRPRADSTLGPLVPALAVQEWCSNQTINQTITDFQNTYLV